MLSIDKIQLVREVRSSLEEIIRNSTAAQLKILKNELHLISNKLFK
jgi:hypothetical protein